MNTAEITSGLVNTLSKHKNILIVIQGSPDPDVLASSFALKVIAELSGIKSTIVALKKPSLPQNSAIIEKTNIPIVFIRNFDDITSFDGYAVLDFQTTSVQGLTGKIPCIIHIDHHEPTKEDAKVEFRIINENVGSVSTIMSLVLKNIQSEIDEDLLTRIATALLYGMETDTDNFLHSGPLEEEAKEFLGQYVDRSVLEKIRSRQFSSEAVSLLWRAIENIIIHKDWLMTGIGYVDEEFRDSIAIIADYLINWENANVVIVFAVIGQKNRSGMYLDASFRTKDKSLNLNHIIKQITSTGGARRYKGAYQIPMDYFINCPDKQKLLEIVNITTVEILKKQRDRLKITEIMSFYDSVKEKIKDLFHE